MASARRIPGEKLVARMSLRLAHASDLAAGGHLAQRLAQRSSQRTELAGSFMARLDRWEQSPMIAWAGVLMGETPSRPFAGFGMPEAVLAMPAEASASPSDAPASTPRRGPRAARRSSRSSAFSPSGRSVVPQSGAPAAHASRPPAGVLGRSSHRARLPQANVPLHSTWARRLLGPASTVVPAGLLSGPQPDTSPPSAARVGAGSAVSRSAAPRRQARRAPARRSPERQLARPDSSEGSSSAAGGPQRSTSGTLPTSPAVSASTDSSAAASMPATVPTALERIDQRQGRPVGIVAGRLASDAVSNHPAARGLDAVRVDSEDPLSDEPSAASVVAFERHPARAMLHALARAGSPQEAARVVVESSAEMRAARNLPAPLAEVVQQIQQQVHQAAKKATLAAPSARVVAKAHSRGKSDAALPTAAARMARGGSGSDSGEVVSLATMRLLRRLKQLVHIAESDRRLLEAQRRVRMAEDSAHARAEAASAPGTDAAGDAQPVDIDTLGREVLAAVNDKLASRNDRRLEDPDVPIDVF